MLLGSHSQNQCVPHGQLMISNQVRGRLKSWPSGVGHLKTICPAKHSKARVRGSTFGFADKYSGQLAQCLRWQDHILRGQLVDELHRLAATQFVAQPLGVSRDVGVKRNPHA